MSWFSKFRKSHQSSKKAFDSLIAETVDDVRSGSLKAKDSAFDEPDESGPADIKNDIAGIKAALSNTFSGQQDSLSQQDSVSQQGGVAVSGDAHKTPDLVPEQVPDLVPDQVPGQVPDRRPPGARAAGDRAAAKSGPNLRAMVRKDVGAGIAAVCAFLVFLIGWSTIAPLTSAAIAPGVISPAGSRKTVQHLEGGIIERILVKDGDQVEAGQSLVLLQDTMARASWQLVRTQYFTLAARHARLLAQQGERGAAVFPAWLEAEASDQDVASILDAQTRLFETALASHSDRKAVLQKKIVQLEKEIEGLNAQIGGQTRQLALIAQEIGGVQELVNKGLERRPRLLGLQRTEADIRAQKGANTAKISRTQQAISATELELIAADTVQRDEVAREIAQVQTELSLAGEKMAASGDILNRIKISAPVGGIVLGLNYHSAGGVIAPGAAIMDIVPDSEELIVEARVSPTDIDVVHSGLVAQIHLTAYSQRNLPMISGTVRQISADRLVDNVTGQPYFLATVEVSREQIEKLGANVKLSPGMPAEVMIVTGEQTLLGYLFQPVLDTLRRSLREG